MGRGPHKSHSVTALQLAFEMHADTLQKGTLSEFRLVSDVIEPAEQAINRVLAEFQENSPSPLSPTYDAWEWENHEILDGVVSTLLSLRTLRNHHQYVLNRAGGQNVRVSELSLIRKHQLHQVVANAVSHCKGMSKEKYGVCPDITVYPDPCDAAASDGGLHGPGDTPSLECLCEGGSVHYITIELLKNAIRANIDRYGVLDIEDAPPIRCRVSQGSGEVGFSIEDSGQGMPYKFRQNLFRYYNTSATPVLEQSGYTYSRNFGSAMSGYGLGLAMSRQYAKHLGGDLGVSSLLGEGTTVSLNFCRNGLHPVIQGY